MRCGGSKLKKPEKCDFYQLFNHLTNDISNYNVLSIEKTIGSCFTNHIRNQACSFRNI